MGLATAECEVHHMVKYRAIVPINIQNAAVQELKQLGKLAQVVVIAEHGCPHQGRLSIAVHAEHISAGREQ